MKKSIESLAVILLLFVGMTACDDNIVNQADDIVIAAQETAKAEALSQTLSHTKSGLAGIKLEEGEAAVIYTFDDYPTDLSREPEGIALDRSGNIFVSDRKGDGTSRSKNEILKIDRQGNTTVLADLGPAAPGCSGVLGLTTDSKGNVYAAFASCNSNHGVWKVRRDGSKRHLAGSENIVVPNALTFDSRGNIYVTDSYPAEVVPPGPRGDEADGPGLVWRYGKSQAFEVWASSILLAPATSDPFPFAAPGANGISFVPPNHVYVANNEKSLILDIQVLPDGSAGPIDVVAGAWPPTGPPGLLTAPDGLAADVHGMLYAAVPPAGLVPFPLSAVIRIDPGSGEVTPMVNPYTVFDPSPLFDFPTSLAFGNGPFDRKSLFVVSPTDAGDADGVGSDQAITQVGVGVPGRMGQ